ncbi:Gfo/Idh/MocA family protein [Microlunatus flavus]|uniref:Predicted dehydrogenase n=1 Tax=Microlunatus flavus TaxID=1036181 RepID=A0A1H9NIJ6_9ACTN|nr:Gfo/Idh/MocA family oxidoreductase [Microlunatus flavus]SER35495.1 Predicted dehydrogenase [Microlunatus flavus]
MTTQATPAPLRLGLLGAARISEDAVVAPAHELGVRLVAVAARDQDRARAFAEQHGVERTVADYQALVDDPEVEAVYNPLANALHAPWNLAAVAAGKPVLSEKPFAGNAQQAREVRDAAARAGVPVVEAFHQLYHPITARLLELAGNGEIGELQHVEARMLMPPPAPDDPRWSAELDGGGLMDVGCYALHAVRDLAGLRGGEPRVLRAVGGEHPDRPGVDAWLTADLELPGGVSARVESSMTHQDVDFSLRLVGSRGEAYAPNFVKPQQDDRVVLTRLGEDPVVEHLGRRTSYTYMLEAFARLVREGVPMRSDADDAVTTMELVDAVYTAAGMAPRAGAAAPAAG